MNLEGCFDADWASNIDDRKSMSGNCVFLGGNLITWSTKKQKVIEIDIHFVCDLVTANKLEVRYIPTELQPTNIFTKALSEPRLQSVRSKLTMEDSMCSLRGGVEGAEPEGSRMRSHTRCAEGHVN